MQFGEPCCHFFMTNKFWLGRQSTAWCMTSNLHCGLKSISTLKLRLFFFFFAAYPVVIVHIDVPREDHSWWVRGPLSSILTITDTEFSKWNYFISLRPADPPATPEEKMLLFFFISWEINNLLIRSLLNFDLVFFIYLFFINPALGEIRTERRN